MLLLNHPGIRKVIGNFDTRKQLFEYDEALNRQRNGVYKERKRILQQKNLRPWIIAYAERTIYDLFLNLKTPADYQQDRMNLQVSRLSEQMLSAQKITISAKS